MRFTLVFPQCIESVFSQVRKISRRIYCRNSDNTKESSFISQVDC